MILALFLTQPTPFRLLLVLLVALAAIALGCLAFAGFNAIESGPVMRRDSRTENIVLSIVAAGIVLVAVLEQFGSFSHATSP